MMCKTQKADPPGTGGCALSPQHSHHQVLAGCSLTSDPSDASQCGPRAAEHPHVGSAGERAGREPAPNQAGLWARGGHHLAGAPRTSTRVIPWQWFCLLYLTCSG